MNINEVISSTINLLDMAGSSDLFLEIRFWWNEMQYPSN
jgi:hypothetical protein